MSTPDDSWTAKDFERHSAWLRRLATALVSGDAQAEDLAQETWLRYVSQPADTGPTRPRLARILHGLSWHARRTESRRKDRERAAARPEQSADPSADEFLARLELSERLVKEVGRLEEDQRSTILLRYFDDLNAEEIAKQIGVSSSTIRSRLNRGLDELRRRLDTHGNLGAFAVASVRWAEEMPIAETYGPVSGATAKGSAVLPMRAKLGLCVAIGTGLAISVHLPIRAWSSPSRLEARQSLDGSGPGPPARSSTVELAELSSDARRELVPKMRSSTSDSSRIPAISGALFAARLVVQGTSEPLASYWVRLVDSDGNEHEIESDENGRVQSVGPWPAGSLRMHGIEHPVVSGWGTVFEAQISEHVHDPHGEGEPVIVGLRVGQTFRFTTTLPGGTRTSDFYVDLLPTQGSISVKNRAPLRGAREPWVRFPAGTSQISGSKPWRLTVESHDGFWSGTTVVGTSDDDAPGPVPLYIEPRGRLSVHVFRDGVPVPRDGPRSMQVDVIRTSPPRMQTFVIQPPEDLEHLTPGEYELVITDPRHVPVRSEVIIAAGETAVVALDVQLRSDLAPVAGVLRSVGGHFDFRGTHLTLSGSRQGESFLCVITPQAGSSVEIPFHFNPVAPGRYVLQLCSRTGRGLSEALTVEAGDEGIVLECEPSEDSRVRYPIVVRAQGSDAPLWNARMMRWSPERTSSGTIARGRATLDGILGMDERWMISAHGYAPWWGGHSDLDPDRTTTIELAPGWGGEIHALSWEGKAQTGVEVFLDGGRLVGKTDEEGRLRFTCAERPETINLDSAVWEVLPGGSVRPDGTFDYRDTGIMVFLGAR